MHAAPAPPAEDSGAHLPITSMLFLGTFGASHSAGSRRYHAQCWTALGLLIAAMLLSPFVDRTFDVEDWQWGWVRTLLLGGTFAFIARAFWQYISGLDEMARRIQMEATALTYLIGLALFAALAGAESRTFHVHPGIFVLLELVRGVALTMVARKYR